MGLFDALAEKMLQNDSIRQKAVENILQQWESPSYRREQYDLYKNLFETQVMVKRLAGESCTFAEYYRSDPPFFTIPSKYKNEFFAYFKSKNLDEEDDDDLFDSDDTDDDDMSEAADDTDNDDLFDSDDADSDDDEMSEVEAKLVKIKKLFDKGLISEADYNRKKEALLEDL